MEADSRFSLRLLRAQRRPQITPPSSPHWKEELDLCGPAMLQSHVPESAGELARACASAPARRLNKVYFCSSGSEGGETAIKFSRAHTGRPGLRYAKARFTDSPGSAFADGRSVLENRIGPLLSDTAAVPFDNTDELEKQLSTKKICGVHCGAHSRRSRHSPSPWPPICYPPKRSAPLWNACSSGRGADWHVSHGPFPRFTSPSASTRHGDSGESPQRGLIPSGAVLMPDEVSISVYSSLKRAIIHTSTFFFQRKFSGMRAGPGHYGCPASGTRSAIRATTMERSVSAAADRSAFRVRDGSGVRGLGMLSGIDSPHHGQIRMKLPSKLSAQFIQACRPDRGHAAVSRQRNPHAKCAVTTSWC